MLLKDVSEPQLQAIAAQARLKPGVLKSLLGSLDVEIREDAATQTVSAVVVSNGAETELRGHIEAMEHGADVLVALDMGETLRASDLAPLDSYMNRRYGHNAPARIDTQEARVSTGDGIDFPAQGGAQGKAADPLTTGLDNFAQNRYGHALLPQTRGVQ